MMTDRTRGGRVPAFLTFAGGQLAFQLVVPVSFGRQRRLGFFVVQAVQVAFGLRGGHRGVKSTGNRWRKQRRACVSVGDAATQLSQMVVP